MGLLDKGLGLPQLIAKVVEAQKIRTTAPLYKSMDTMGAGSLDSLWHGTPHTFPPTPDAPLGQFLNEKIGSGEGAQAYTYGHYVSGNQGTAKSYQDKLSGNNRRSAAVFDTSALQQQFPDTKYMAPLSRNDQVAYFLTGKQEIGKLSPLSHLKASLAKQGQIRGSADSYDYSSLLGDAVRRLNQDETLGKSGIIDTLMRNEQLSPEQLALLRRNVDANLAVQAFGPTAKMGSTLGHGTQLDVLKQTLSPAEFDDFMQRSIGADFSNPRQLNDAVITTGMNSGEFKDVLGKDWSGKQQPLDLYNPHYQGLWKPWDERRGLSDAVMEALGIPLMQAPDVGRNILAQNARYQLRDYAAQNGMPALQQALSANTTADAKGALYRVLSQVAPSDFWLLDAPIGQGSGHLPLDVLNGMKQMATDRGADFSRMGNVGTTGMDAYNQMRKLGTGANKELTDQLLDQGVPGAMFLRGGHRGDWAGVLDKPFAPDDYNYVFYDPNMAKIMDKQKTGGLVK